MTYKQSCTLIVLVFVILSLIGSIPYLYINFSYTHLLQVFTDSLFESVSGFTTTGFSVIPDVTQLPQSIILYRSLTQFIGGIGIVLVLLAFFYPEAKLKEFAKSMGISKDNHKIKKTFIFIISMYCLFTIAMVAVGYASGYHNLINLSAVVFSSISTAGFTPFTDATAMTIMTQPPFNVIVPLSMIFGATNFLLFAKLYNKKFKEFFNSETTFFMIIFGISVGLLVYFYNLPSAASAFQVLSAMSTTGFSYLAIGGLDDSLKLFLVLLMFIGGASFSTAGGIKIYRFILLIKSVGKSVTFTIAGKDSKVKLFGKEYSNPEVIQAATLVFLMVGVIFVSAFIVSYYGYQPVNALFDCTSALCTTGLTTGVVGPSLVLELKWLFMFLMLLGRVEVIAFLVMLSRTKEPHHNGHSCRNGKKNGERNGKVVAPAPVAPSDVSS
jgi:trk system potassium uptake protein TrkH